MTPDDVRRTRLAELGAGSCVLVPKLVIGDPVGRCNGCGTDLPRRRDGSLNLNRRWCGASCRVRWLGDHFWGYARDYALARSGGFVWGEKPDWGAWHAAIARARCDECGARRNGMALEVNHVDPRVGAGYDNGCWNHQTNLQVLCHPCHVAETTRQIRERRGIPAGGRPAPDRFPGARPEPIWGAA